MKLKALLTGVLLIAVQANAAPRKGITCADDALPDGDREEYLLKLNAGGKYDLTYIFTDGDMRDGVAEPVEAVIAKNLDCEIGKMHKQIATCSETNGQPNAWVQISMIKELSVSSGKERSSEYAQVVVSTQELAEAHAKGLAPQDTRVTKIPGKPDRATATVQILSGCDPLK